MKSHVYARLIRLRVRVCDKLRCLRIAVDFLSGVDDRLAIVDENQYAYTNNKGQLLTARPTKASWDYELIRIEKSCYIMHILEAQHQLSSLVIELFHTTIYAHSIDSIDVWQSLYL